MWSIIRIAWAAVLVSVFGSAGGGRAADHGQVGSPPRQDAVGEVHHDEREPREALADDQRGESRIDAKAAERWSAQGEVRVRYRASSDGEGEGK